jgi:hypothetical protein
MKKIARMVQNQVIGPTLPMASKISMSGSKKSENKDIATIITK